MNTKLHAIAEANGRPLSFFITAGRVSVAADGDVEPRLLFLNASYADQPDPGCGWFVRSFRPSAYERVRASISHFRIGSGGFQGCVDEPGATDCEALCRLAVAKCGNRRLRCVLNPAKRKGQSADQPFCKFWERMPERHGRYVDVYVMLQARRMQQPVLIFATPTSQVGSSPLCMLAQMRVGSREKLVE